MLAGPELARTTRESGERADECVGKTSAIRLRLRRCGADRCPPMCAIAHERTLSLVAPPVSRW